MLGPVRATIPGLRRTIPLRFTLRRAREKHDRSERICYCGHNIGRLAMKIVVFVLTISTVTPGLVTRAQAQNYPWCAVLNMGDVAYNCGFVSKDQCMASVSGIGGFCQENNLYQPPATSRASWPHRH
jgi:Protein of unknown function (DUF3551)